MSAKNQKSTLTVEQRLEQLEMRNAELEKINAHQDEVIDNMKSQRRGKSLGSAVLLRNKNDESKFILLNSIIVDRDLHSRMGVEIENNEQEFGLAVAQLDASMNQSAYPVHDRLDPIGVDNATSFWVDIDSDFQVELFSEHVERDPMSAYNMLDPDRNARKLSVGVQKAQKAS